MRKNEHIMIRIIIYLGFFQAIVCEKGIIKFFDKLNNETKKFNAIAADLYWQATLTPSNTELSHKAGEFMKEYLTWQRSTCNKLERLQYMIVLNKSQERQIYLLCKGPQYSFDEVRDATKLLETLQSIYADSEICIPDSRRATRDNLTSVEQAILGYLAKARWPWHKEKIFLLNNEEGLEPDPGSYCIRGENDFNRIMGFSRNEDVLKWIWETWRDVITPMKEPYQKMVAVQNKAAVKGGYMDIGESWRMDLEIPDLKQLCDQLYDTVKPLYKLIHGVTRYFLRREYGMMVPERGPIPAHLLGDLWSTNWEPLADLIFPKTIDLSEKMKQAKVKWDVNHMLRRAEDFYVSLGLPPMTEAFWRESVFSRQNYTEARCHGSAADMFKDGDFRIIYCANVTFQDFYVIHHEMGHIQYYMAYEKQPAIFRQANSALQESIGDTIMIGVMAPQHLHRLGLVDDSVLYSEAVNYEPHLKEMGEIMKEITDDDYDVSIETVTTDEDQMQADGAEKSEKAEPEITPDVILLLRQALYKIPQIPFALAMDEYRWKYFSGDIDKRFVNTEFWSILESLQGIAPPEKRGDEYFDVGAKFHVPDNTPFVRYYLSSFLQHQLYESLCKAAVYGRRNVKDAVPTSILIHRCDIYGSKSAGKLLRDIMSRGHSQTLPDILEATIGTRNISALALERYYLPLIDVLQGVVNKYRIPLGW